MPVINHKASIAQIPDKDRGVRARRAIMPGEKVMDEVPLFIRPINASSYMINAVYQSLSEADRASFDGLHNRYTGTTTVPHGIFKTNAIPFSADPSSASNGPDSGALLTLGSRVNHSCCPNLAAHYDHAVGKFVFLAIKAIAEGEEMCISYACDLLAPRDRRQAHLLERYNFRCICGACMLTGNDLRASNQRRSDAGAWQREMEDTQIELGTRLRKAAPILDALQKEGIAEICQLHVCETALVLYESIGKNTDAKVWGCRALDTLRMVKGPNHRESRRMERKLAELL